MKVWMTIGYADYEGKDKVFVNKEKAVESVLEMLYGAWEDGDPNNSGVVQGHTKEEFIGKTKEYIMNHPEKTYWYMWVGSSFWKEIFSDWEDFTDTNEWFGLHGVDLED